MFAAVSLEYDRVALHEGLHNCGEASTKDIGEQSPSTVKVPAVRPESLPPCDVLKLDTEGCELDSSCATIRICLPCKLVLLEAHGSKDHDELHRLLAGAGYECIKDTQTMAERWTLGWEKKP